MGALQRKEGEAKKLSQLACVYISYRLGNRFVVMPFHSTGKTCQACASTGSLHCEPQVKCMKAHSCRMPAISSKRLWDLEELFMPGAGDTALAPMHWMYGLVILRC